MVVVGGVLIPAGLFQLELEVGVGEVAWVGKDSSGKGERRNSDLVLERLTGTTSTVEVADVAGSVPQ